MFPPATARFNGRLHGCRGNRGDRDEPLGGWSRTLLPIKGGYLVKCGRGRGPPWNGTTVLVFLKPIDE